MDWKCIESRVNPAVKFAASLSDKKNRDREGLFVAHGLTLFFDFCQSGLYPKMIYLSQDASDQTDKIVEALGGADTEGYLLSPSAFEKISTEKGAQGLVSVYAASDLPSVTNKLSRVLALERVQDPGNVGTAIRTAAAFGFDAVFLVSCADPFGPKTVRATMGALGRIPVCRFADVDGMFDALREQGIRTVAACLSETARPITEVSLDAPVCILIGNEGKGLSPEAVSLSDLACIIPIERMESLNAASAATIFLWEARRNR